MSRCLLLLCIVALLPARILAAEPGTPLTAPTARQVLLPKETMPLSEALNSIAMQTGIVVRDNRSDKDAPVKLKMAERTFWETLDALADTAGLQPYAFNADGALSLVPRRPEIKQRISYAGPFRISLLRLTCTDDFENSGRSCAARLQILWEPTLKPFYLNDRPQKVTVRGDKDGQPTTLDSDGVVSLAPLDGRIGLVCDIPMPVVARTNSKLVAMTGIMKALIPGKMLTFRFPTLDRLALSPMTLAEDNISWWKPRTVCVVESINLNKNAWTVKMRIRAPAGEKFESNLSWIVHNEMNLVSVDGTRRLASSRFSILKMTNEAVIVYTFVDTPAAPLGNPAGWTLSYTTPASIVEMTIPFSFQDVPLP